jgi:pimeloyl-ACP methyl ester carboxylesterase
MVSTVENDIPARAIRIPVPGGESVVLHDLGGRGPTLLFAHATGFHGHVWRPVAELLRARAHCLAIDFRGHGDSQSSGQADTDPLHWDVFRDDVLAVLATLSDGHEIVGVGHSMGGAALLMAELARPGSFSRLVLFEPAVRGDVGPLPADALQIQTSMVGVAKRRRAVFASRAEALTNFAAKAPLSGFQAAALLAYVDHGFADDPGRGVVLKCLPDIEASIYAQSYSHGTEERLDGVTCPVTIAFGGDSRPADRATHAALAARLGTEPVILADVDHFGPLQLPAQFAALVQRTAFGG